MMKSTIDIVILKVREVTVLRVWPLSLIRKNMPDANEQIITNKRMIITVLKIIGAVTWSSLNCGSLSPVYTL